MTRKKLYAVLSILYFLGNVSQHENANHLVDWLVERCGRPTLDHWQVIGEWAALALFLPFFIPALRRSPEGRRLALLWLLLALALLGTEEWVVVKKIEHIHYPQFALQAALLYGAFGDWRPAFLVGVLLGALDEAHQALVPGRVFDVGDVWLNLLGCAAGVLLVGAFRRSREAPF